MTIFFRTWRIEDSNYRPLDRYHAYVCQMNYACFGMLSIFGIYKMNVNIVFFFFLIKKLRVDLRYIENTLPKYTWNKII